MAEIKVSQSSYAKIHQLSHVSLLNAVRVYPENVDFDGRDANEQIILFLRQHPIVLVPAALRAIGIFLFLLLIIWVFNTVFPSFSLTSLSLVLFIAGSALSISTIVYEIFKWYYTVTLITSTRIIDLDFNSILDSKWSTTMLRTVQDVSYSSPGFVNTLFDMADLVILTASHKENFELSNLPKARDIQDILMDLVENEKEYAPLDDEL